MSNVQIFYLLLAVAVGTFIGIKLFKKWRYTKAMGQEFPESKKSILTKRLPVYQKLNTSLQNELHSLIQHFLYTKKFVGCAGLEINEEIETVIAAEACLLILNRPSTRYQSLKWIYVYPSTFEAKRNQQDAYGIVTEGRTKLLGVSWSNGRVILAWDSVEKGMADFDDGHNVVLHEFAHQLDQEDGAADGAPLLYTRDSYQIWAQVFSREFEELQIKLSKGKSTLIDSYGATNPAEFFAVVTELYFERPAQMRKRHPELFDVMKNYYQLDTLDWQRPQ